MAPRRSAGLAEQPESYRDPRAEIRLSDTIMQELIRIVGLLRDIEVDVD